MFDRKIIHELKLWAKKEPRKPLIVRGARQVGKTTAIHLFSKQFDQYIYLNLEQSEDRSIFEQDFPMTQLVDAIFFYKNQTKGTGKILIFIDEIQASLSAVTSLRFFYENFPELYVIAAGSLLETLMGNHVSFPVGRVEYLVMKPLTFKEFLNAVGETIALDMLNKALKPKITTNNKTADAATTTERLQIKKFQIPLFAHEKLTQLFASYALIGGMPEIVLHYSKHRDITALNPLFESLITAYIDDVKKYARNQTMTHVIRHAISSAFLEAGNRIKFQGFGNSNYKSREMGEALRILEKAMLLTLIYPSSSMTVPLQTNLKKSPKLQFLDTGMLNYFAGFQKELFGKQQIDTIYQGKIAEHIVGQELLATRRSLLHPLSFWTREKRQSNAEVDFLIQVNDLIIPIEVKSGPTGRLRSLHQFIDNAPHSYAVRIYSGELSIDRIQTINNKPCILLNLPFYLTGSITQYIEEFIASENGGERMGYRRE